MEKQPLDKSPPLLSPGLGSEIGESLGGGDTTTTPQACEVTPGFAVLTLAELLGWVCFFKVSPRGRISQMRCGSSGNSSWLSARPSLITQLASEEGTAVQALAGVPTLRLLPNPRLLFYKNS